MIQAERFESLGRLAGGVAHDFNNVLVAIGGFAALLDERVRGREDEERMVGQILLAAGHGGEMVEELRRFAHPVRESGQVVELNAEIARVERLLVQATGSAVTLDLTLCERDLPVELSPGVLLQILLNLVQNAADASERGSEVTITSALREGDAGICAVLSVADTGSGMTEEVRRRAFKPFFTTKGAGSGTGMGLVSVETAVRSAGGTVELQSAPGKGTVVTVGLPLVREHAAAR